MKANRRNFCGPVLCALDDLKVSRMAVLNAVNSALGELESTSEETKTGAGRVTKMDYKVSTTTTAKYIGEKSNAPLLFDAWASAIERANKVAEFDTVSIPAVLKPWLNKFIKSDKPETKPETAKA